MSRQGNAAQIGKPVRSGAFHRALISVTWHLHSLIRMPAFSDAGGAPAPGSLGDLFLFRLPCAIRAVVGMATRIADEGFGITHREWELIAALRQIGEATPSAFAEHLQWDRVRTSRGLGSLSQKGLVERRRDAEDGRGVHVRLSPQGQQLFDDLFPRIARLDAELVAGIDDAQAGIFLQCLSRIELRAAELNAKGAVPESASRSAGGTRRRWPRYRA
ncbi:DNA-binding MarR family transcriptional regulator [Variovorax boronicumulans]|uniref:DNA-binding MarR family transcriptional regulator n=1 Tax=Variovorax boronicumulans TaxID=436515 RepID=A0AAW8CST8_9BURK|nr:MarR family transcriptional regulator [Variovorax boronicumulans]MDP9892341.1 DNA-binding MarR family transcriptional regulator [Variovorax boronicumulans]MDQ0052180.1 DNA-binding MarR family transcriptional regulator [Variovorax boronicumulans]